MGGDGPGRVHRVAWLLRANRLYGERESLVNADRFAREFRGGCSDRSADRAQISRWERGSEAAGHLVVRRYEELLGLPAASLHAVADTIYREVRHGGGPRALPRRIDIASPRVVHSTSDLLDAATGAGVMTGADWDTLTANLTAARTKGLPWDALAQRLLAELIISGGPGWQLRSESVIRLLRDRRGELAMVSACGALAADSANQVFIEPLVILEGAGHREAARQVIRHVVSPVNDHARQGAWWAAAEKIVHGHFSDTELRVLAHQALAVLAGDAPQMGCRTAAAELLRRMPVASVPIGSMLRRALAGDEMATNVYGAGRTKPAMTSQVIVSRLAQNAISCLPRDALGDDPMLRCLLDEILFHPHISRRTISIQMIEFTPYRLPVASALIRELSQRQVREDAIIAVPLVQALSTLGDPDGRRLIEDIALDPHLPRPTVEAATWGLAHVRGQSTEAFWAAMAARHLTSDASAFAARGFAYSAGIGGKTAWLHQLRDDPAPPAPARTAAAWWLNYPEYLLVSARL